MNENRRDILIRFGIVYFIIVMIFIAIIVKIVIIQTTQRPMWMKLAASLTQPDRVAPATRGNIYSEDGQLFASTMPEYHLVMDMRTQALHDTLRHHKTSLFYEKVDSLCRHLAAKFGDKSVQAYKMALVNAYKKRDPRFSVYPDLISYSDLKEVLQFPLFNLGRLRSGLIEDVYARRIRPFGDIGSRTIGGIYGDESMGGKNGIELAFDTLLRGKPGLYSRQRIAGSWENVVVVPPENGADIITTLNANIQDITENALRKELIKTDAKEGCAIVMETKTGEIKAVANLTQQKDSTYAEARNEAFADETEPGSTFKVASIMAALDQGLISPNDTINTGNGVYDFFGTKMHDWNEDHGGFHKITVAQAVWYSSNIGVSRTIYNAYKNNPAAFVDKLYEMKLNQPIHFHIPGAGIPIIKHPDEKNTHWSLTTLPWMSIGYEVQIPPIYTLTFYNAIANNGKMIRPFLVKAIEKKGKVVQTFSTSTIKDQICKPSTLSIIKSMLLGVVEHGTGANLQSPYVQIAGKSGTAQISKGASGYKTDGVEYQVSFCGYFPATDPQYTVICVIRKPKIGYASGGLMAGAVVKEIALLVNASKITLTPNSLPSTGEDKIPMIKSGDYNDVKTVLSRMSINFLGDKNQFPWITATADSNYVTIHSMAIPQNGVPNVISMGAKDAVYLLGNAGLNVQLVGCGKVISQSLPPNSALQKGATIVLTLH
ncbi:penicillin-binding protein [Microbacter margulisiae]|uniref:Cell division protein FtsI (Penicillin-binding protein 3) n=1 Tax=Microbacter margulisiae TaxID=1350067 RepID=A0A7W5H2H6_9PORP|nr:penicillin-binding protein [Microbacter margulisiae]MBB3187431.1 cell division protein FtsI (penicillin-binding protein 3) [Microbacter margulisiae]